MKVTFKTKTGQIVSFNRKTDKKLSRPPRRSRRALRNRPKNPVNVESQSRRKPRHTKKVRTMPRKRSRSRGGRSTGKLTDVLLGGAVAGFLGSMIPFGDYGKVGAAALAHKQGGIIGNTAKALGVIGVANLVQGAGISSILPTSTSAAVKW